MSRDATQAARQIGLFFEGCYVICEDFRLQGAETEELRIVLLAMALFGRRKSGAPCAQATVRMGGSLRDELGAKEGGNVERKTAKSREVTWTDYQAITLSNYEKIPQIQRLPEAIRWDVRVVGTVLPFRTNQYVVDELIDWNRGPDDPIFRINIPHRDMLEPEHYDQIDSSCAVGQMPERSRTPPTRYAGS